MVTKTGKELELRVAQAYRAMGAWRVEHNVELAGHQIDIYVEMLSPDRSLYRIAIEAKDYARPVGIKIASDFSNVVARLRRLRLVDTGVIVSAAGFSNQARNAVKGEEIRLLTPDDLDAMVAGAEGVKQPPPANTPLQLAAAELGDENSTVRFVAAQKLAKSRDHSTIPLLARCLLENEPDPSVRYWLAYALGQIGGEEACAALKKAEVQETHPLAKQGIAEGLRAAGCRKTGR